jgi:predicted Rossmann fold nucleotide-binding protein DprA/Smf involved in DNA uptake
MKEIEILLKAVADGLKSMADGLTMIARKVDAVAKTQPGKSPSRAGKTSSSQTPKAPKKTSRRARSKTGKPLPATEKVYQAIQHSGKGLNNADICAETNLDKKQVSNALFRLKKSGKIKAVRRGIYIAV